MTQEKKHSGTGQDCPKGYKSCDGYRIPKEWHIVRFDSLFSRVTRKNDENNQNVLTISAQQGLINQIEYYNTLYASENKTGYTLLYRGDFSYNKSYSSGYAYGAIKRLDAYEKGIVSPLYLCFTPRQGVNSDFYLQYFEAGCFDREIYKIAQEGARNHGLLNVSTEDFFHSMLVFPPLEEQERITEILTQCDHVIELKEQKLDELKQLKKEFLRKMFPTKGCDTPEIRFPRFTGAWEQRKLGELSRSFEYGLNAAAKEYDGQNKYLRITDIDDTSRQFVAADITSPDANLAEADNYRLSDGDVLFARTGASVGKTYLYKKSDGLVYFAGFLIRARIKESVSAGFIFQNTLTRSYERYIAITSQRSGQPGVNAQEYAEYQLMLPELFEQEKIAKLLEALDTLITLHQRELEETKTYKKTLAKLLLTGIVRVQG